MDRVWVAVILAASGLAGCSSQESKLYHAATGCLAAGEVGDRYVMSAKKKRFFRSVVDSTAQKLGKSEADTTADIDAEKAKRRDTSRNDLVEEVNKCAGETLPSEGA